MPLIQIYTRGGVLGTKEKKAKAIHDVAAALANVIADGDAEKSEWFRTHSTVILSEIPDEDWGRNGEQVND